MKIFSAATRRALRQEQELRRQQTRKPIVSIDGRDVEELPSTKDQAA